MHKIIIISDHWEWRGELLLGVSPLLDDSLAGTYITTVCMILSMCILYGEDRNFLIVSVMHDRACHRARVIVSMT